MKPGDVYVTNDPWLGTGHLFDYVMMTPVFLGKKLVAFFASTCHVIDVGGVGMSAKANSSFEEGTLIPHLKMRKEGRLNEELLSIILANSRNPVEVRGDLLSLISANDTGARRLIDMMREFKLDRHRHARRAHPHAIGEGRARGDPGAAGRRMVL